MYDFAVRRIFSHLDIDRADQCLSLAGLFVNRGESCPEVGCLIRFIAVMVPIIAGGCVFWTIAELMDPTIGKTQKEETQKAAENEAVANEDAANRMKQ